MPRPSTSPSSPPRAPPSAIAEEGRESAWALDLPVPRGLRIARFCMDDENDHLAEAVRHLTDGRTNRLARAGEEPYDYAFVVRPSQQPLDTCRSVILQDLEAASPAVAAACLMKMVADLVPWWADAGSVTYYNYALDSAEFKASRQPSIGLGCCVACSADVAKTAAGQPLLLRVVPTDVSLLRLAYHPHPLHRLLRGAARRRAFAAGEYIDVDGEEVDKTCFVLPALAGALVVGVCRDPPVLDAAEERFAASGSRIGERRRALDKLFGGSFKLRPPGSPDVWYAAVQYPSFFDAENAPWKTLGFIIPSYALLASFTTQQLLPSERAVIHASFATAITDAVNELSS
ncbi:hypothetical protein DIPPA_31724 [Diplonema papillatum]|nr:hypothetical protein DIPPA_31724 [Diplonema papillatum]